MIERGWGATMVLTEPDAGSDVGAGRTKAVQQEDGTWHIDGVKRFITSAEQDLTENIMHLVLARPEGGPSEAGHQGPVAVPRAEVPLRPGDRRAGRAQRRLRHQRRAQDGPQGLHHVRADVRPARRARQGLAARRGARRHRADVRGHRVRADDGRHQGDRDAVDRLPERAGLRQGARAGRRPDADDGQDRAARHDHPPPRRAPQPDAAEGVRRGPARRLPVHRDVPGPGRARRRRRGRWRRRSTTCCCRSSRASARSGPTSSWRSRCRPSAARASCRTTRSSSTSATRRSTRCTRAPPRSSRWTSSSARSSATRARRSATSPARSRSSSTPRAATAGSRRSARCSSRRSRTCRACSAR